MSTRGRSFCFTINNYNDECIMELNVWLVENTSYAIYGKEVGEGGTPHIQGYFEKERCRIGPLGRKRFNGIGWHIVVAKGNATQNANYCKKGTQSHAEWELDGIAGAHYGDEADVWTHGAPKVSGGKRTDLDKVKKLIHDGVVTNEKTLADAYGVNYQAFRMGCIVLEHRRRSPSRSPPSVFWLFGATGTGKSRAVAKFIDNCMDRRGFNYWKSVGALKWFNGYSGQEIAWFDDYRFGGRADSFKFAQFLNLLDRYALNVEFKGGVTPWYPKIICITTPQDIDSTFPAIADFEDLGQVKRRITQVYDFNGNGLQQWNESIIPFLSGPDDRGSGEPLDLSALDPFEPIERDVGAEEAKGEESDNESVATVPYDPPVEALIDIE
jgi:hypothetical protein